MLIKYPFWKMTAANPEATYACVNYGEVCTVNEIAERSIVISADIGKVINELGYPSHYQIKQKGGL